MLVVALLLPASVLALVGLALLGSRVQGERAQRLADAAALRAALDRRQRPTRDGVITTRQAGGAWIATVQLRPTSLRLIGLPPVAFTARASAVARRISPVDGGSGAVLIG
ncbi:MAG: hypothetical protein ACR2J9_09150 [Gaiellales bacterium]